MTYLDLKTWCFSFFPFLSFSSAQPQKTRGFILSIQMGHKAPLFAGSVRRHGTCSLVPELPCDAVAHGTSLFRKQFFFVARNFTPSHVTHVTAACGAMANFPFLAAFSCNLVS